MRRIHSSNSARASRIWCLAPALCLAGAACVAESDAEELGTVRFTAGQPVAASATLPGATGLTETGSLTGAATSEAQAPVAVETEDPSDVGADPTLSEAETTPVGAEPAVGAEEPIEAEPATPVDGTDLEPLAGSGESPTLSGEPEEPTEGAEPGEASEPEEPAEPEPVAEPVGPGMLTVSFMSKGPGGRYAPRNCGAVWIEDENGQFVKTIERWTRIRQSYLRNWNRASGGWGFSFFGGSTDNPDQVDVVTAGTLRNHEMHMSTWNMKNVDGEVVPDGKYSVVVEVSEGNPGVDRVEFEKGPMPQMITGDGSVFSNMTVNYTH